MENNVIKEQQKQTDYNDNRNEKHVKKIILMLSMLFVFTFWAVTDKKKRTNKTNHTKKNPANEIIVENNDNTIQKKGNVVEKKQNPEDPSGENQSNISELDHVKGNLTNEVIIKKQDNADDIAQKDNILQHNIDDIEQEHNVLQHNADDIKEEGDVPQDDAVEQKNNVVLNTVSSTDEIIIEKQDNVNAIENKDDVAENTVSKSGEETISNPIVAEKVATIEESHESTAEGKNNNALESKNKENISKVSSTSNEFPSVFSSQGYGSPNELLVFQ